MMIGHYKVWLDDCRPMPLCYDTHITNADDAIKLINTGLVKAISFDHDLGDNNKTGYTVAKEIERLAYEDLIPPIICSIHTDNPVGRQNICAALQNAYRYWGPVGRTDY